MNRFFMVFLCALSLILSLAGCGVHVTAPDDQTLQEEWDQARSEVKKGLEEGLKNHSPDMTKRHVYRVLDSQDQELYNITGETQVQALDSLLSPDDAKWEENTAAEEGGETACTYIYRQEKTLLAGQDPEAEREYEDLVRFTVHQDQDLITLRILYGAEVVEGVERAAGIDLTDMLTFTFSAPAETMASLRDPAALAGE